MQTVSRDTDVGTEPNDGREWLENRLHYIEHAIESLLTEAPRRCRLCGEAIGNNMRPGNAAIVSLCLICQRNGGLNARFRTP
jgi:hypothetical protein